MRETPPIENTETGYRLGDLEILFGEGGKGKLLRANSLILHGPRNIVVDPAACESRHVELAKDGPVLFYTHYHADHRAAEHVYPQTTEVWTSRADASAIEDPEEFVRRVDSSGSKISKQMFHGLQKVFRIGPRVVERRMDDGDVLGAGGCRAELFHLPGHTPGHMGLFFEEQSLLYLTDMDLTAFGPWYGNDVSDPKAFRASIARARDFECKWYYSSHGEVIWGREEFLEKLDAFDAHFERRDSLILDALAEGEKSIKDMCMMGVVYRPKKLAVAENLVYFEHKHIRFHLEDLVARGLVVADEEFKRFARA